MTTLIFIICQIVLFRNLKGSKLDEDERVFANLDDIEEHSSYENKYETFLDRARSDLIDSEIK